MGRKTTAGAPATTAGCPCGGASYATCCGRFIDGNALPSTARELMRSRYTAYVLRNDIYVRKTWCGHTRPSGALFEEPLPQWLGLNVLADTQDGDSATVEFVARYKVNGRAHKLHEVSRFTRERNGEGNMAWCYVDGQFP